MPRKTFKVAVAAEPIAFDIEAPESKTMHNFQCRDRLSAGKLMKFAEMFSAVEEIEGDGPENAALSAKQASNAIPAVRDFFNAALTPHARDRFWALIEDDDEGVPLDTLVEIAGWLAEVYSGDRPTGETSSPTSGETSPAVGSGVSYSRPDTPTPSPSELASSSTS
jgi:hypothetical protein